MSLDRTLAEVIKGNFGRISSAQLQEIVQGGNPGRWSAEAIAAADEILRERQGGIAPEPGQAPGDPEPLPTPPFPYGLGLVLGFLPVFALNGFRFGSELTQREAPDLPVPFGHNLAWLALETRPRTNARCCSWPACGASIRRPWTSTTRSRPVACSAVFPVGPEPPCRGC